MTPLRLMDTRKTCSIPNFMMNNTLELVWGSKFGILTVLGSESLIWYTITVTCSLQYFDLRWAERFLHTFRCSRASTKFNQLGWSFSCFIHALIMHLNASLGLAVDLLISPNFSSSTSICIPISSQCSSASSLSDDELYSRMISFSSGWQKANSEYQIQ